MVQANELPHAHILLDNNLLPNNNNIDDDTTSAGSLDTIIISSNNKASQANSGNKSLGVCRGPSSASSTSGYDDSSDGEDNHLMNHTLLRHHDPFINRQQQPSPLQQIVAAAKTDRDDNSKLIRDTHLVDEMRGLRGCDPHQQHNAHHQMQTHQMKANSVTSSVANRQLNNNYLTAPRSNSNVDASRNDDDLDLVNHQQQDQQQQRYHHHHRRDSNLLTQVRPLGLSLFPIDDFDLVEESHRFSDGEKQLRIKMCAVYRLIEIYGWSMGIYNHVTVG